MGSTLMENEVIFMMDAIKARALTKVARDKQASAELSEIELKINDECRAGRNKLIIRGRVASFTQNKLQHLGYKVTVEDDQREGTWTAISWE